MGAKRAFLAGRLPQGWPGGAKEDRPEDRRHHGSYSGGDMNRRGGVVADQGQRGFRRLKRICASKMPAGATMVVVFKSMCRTSGFARPQSCHRICLCRTQPTYFIVLLLVLPSAVGTSNAGVAGFSVTVSSNEAQHILI